jgi:S-formylglutathione hydrolase FrmB
MKYIVILFISVFKTCFLFAAEVDTVTISSRVMQKDIRAVVIKPSTYEKSVNRFPTVYLLHGYGGSFRNWITRVPELSKLADANQLLIVCPDGDTASWYFDSPVNQKMKYETYIGKEVPAYIDERYKTIPHREARAITGLSMGGHGAMFIGYRHAQTFGGMGSMSGAVDLEGLKKSRLIKDILGDTISNEKYYQEFNVMNLVKKYPTDSVAIIIDCGVDDFLFEANQKLHQVLLNLKTPHDYIERPGKHDWP